ncbi:WD repeat-containing protein on Y chromosome-like [Harmonia axyridis]|uniref:WD repeat-containing protein on Y chromosome-like n=1 Tax=Harmonia axyridis TaxID=115357 RepID=UPI001E276A74|nr:WD repeat-containing protein on Y chromosome-like [Harmonia axyridis]
MALSVGKSLLELIDEQQLLRIQIFFDREEGRRLDEEKLKDVLWRVAKVDYPDEEFSVLFNKINLSRDGFVTWDEFISFLILTFQQKEIQIGYESLEPPIPSPPTMLKSMHRHPVNTIAYSPTVRPDRTISWNDGSVMTCSKDGCINYWSLDMQHERQVQSSCILLKVSPTWVLTTVVMPDVSIVCTAGTERDLRFYDTSARKFELRVMISSIDYAVAAMHYVFSQNINEESKLLLGDLHGNIRVIYIQSAGRGPFKSTPGIPLLSVRFEKIIRNQVEGFRYVDFGRQHTDFVRQISWYPTLHSIVSCASCPKVAMLMKDITGAKENYTYKIPKGVWCFSVVEGIHLFSTGGPDCLVRIWNPFVRNKPTAILYGHHTGIVHMVLQDGGKRLYSLSRDKCIKVWDVANQVCLQTYLGLPPELGEYSDLATLYNPESRQWIIGSQMIAIIPLSPKQDGEHTDGNTHVGGVSVVLYNPLYKLVVTCGLDSYIIVWNPWDGRRMCVVKDAHTKLLHGENLPIEITAAAFDPGYQRLLTAAHDGTLKVWNFNTGTCLRNMNVGSGQEITSVVWVKGRMMAVGWNRRVTEFADGTAAVGPGGVFCKNWDLRHKEDISSAVVRVPQSLATATYNGELILWRLETGQAYKQFNVSDPTTRIKIQYKVVKDRKKSTVLATVSKKARKSVMQAKKESVVTDEMKIKMAKRGTIMGRNILGAKKLSMVMVPEECVPLRKLAVHCMLFLEFREPEPNVGTLLVSLENGSVQMWSHHTNGNFITSFQAVHKAGDYVISMCSSKDNEYLFTGTSVGYVKVWLIINFCTPHKKRVFMPKYRLMFPFLWRDVFVGRAKRVVTNQPEPLLLNSIRCHRMPTSGIIFIDEAEIFITCSTDCSARMWTIGGRYIQTIGTFKEWKKLEVGVKPPQNFEFSEPPDIKRVASSTTFRVLRGGTLIKQLSKKKLAQLAARELTAVDYSKVYGKRLEEPILGHHFKLPDRSALPPDIKFDSSFAYIPVYQHLIMPQPVALTRPPTPPAIKEIMTIKIEKDKPKHKP